MKVDTINYIIPDEIESGWLDTSTVLNTYELVSKEYKVILRETNNNLFNTYCDLDTEITFDVFIQPKNSLWMKQDVFNFVPDKKFNVLVLDPPWMLNGSNPIRGPALQYTCPKLSKIISLDLNLFQTQGLIAIWTINRSYQQVLKWLQYNDYELIHELFWCKITKRGKIHKSVGHYLQHGMEICLIAVKNDKQVCTTIRKTLKCKVNNHILWSARRLQSQKPDKLYEIVEDWYRSSLINDDNQNINNNDEKLKNYNFLELFGRSINVRRNWMTVGYQVLPSEDDCWIFLNPEGEDGLSGSIVL